MTVHVLYQGNPTVVPHHWDVTYGTEDGLFCMHGFACKPTRKQVRHAVQYLRKWAAEVSRSKQAQVAA